MRSRREDDASKPMLEAMRKAADQFSGRCPGFIAVQQHGLAPTDLMLPHLRRRAAVLANALFGHYGGDHVNAVAISAFGAGVPVGSSIGTRSFAVLNPEPRHPVSASDAPVFLSSIRDRPFADRFSAPRPSSLDK